MAALLREAMKVPISNRLLLCAEFVPRGTRAAETVAPAFAAQPQPDPGPQRRQRLAGTVGLGGATLLTLALVASQAPRRANAHTTKKGEPHAR